MSEFYTNAIQYGDNILVRGYRDGVAFSDKVEYMPTIFVTADKPSRYKTIDGQSVHDVKPGTIKDTKIFIESFKTVENMTVYGNTDYHRQYVSDQYPGEIKYDFDLIKIYSIDIETTTEYGFPSITDPNEEITLISIKDRYTKRTVVFGVGKWSRSQENVRYVECTNEVQLMREFLSYWQYNYPDAITGWNVNLFDIPYMVARITRVLGSQYANKLSPWKTLYERNITINQKPEISYRIRGIPILDYLELYKKFTYVTQESYKLDHIAYVELGENKKENPGTSFKDFYTNFWDDFVEYNIHDAHLVDMLDDKLRLLELVTVLAYFAKINYDDIFSPVGMWDSIIYNYLKDRDIVIPMRTESQEGEGYEGAFVRDPVAGYHKWIASFDLNSLYPHLIMQYNISPETITSYCVPSSVQQLLKNQIDTMFVVENDLSMSGNGWCYRKDTRGFLPELMEKLYRDRSNHKKHMLSVEQDYENTKNKLLLKEISRLDNLQMALKIALNSLYGALGNAYFRYYDVRMAEGITQSGQLSIQWIANKLNSFMNKTMKTEDVPYVVYGDTDSIYLSLESLVERFCDGKTDEQKIQYMDKVCEEIIQPFIDKSFGELANYMNAYEQKMVMKREVLADKGIFVKKKMYILNVHNSEGVQFAEPKLKVKGLAMVRSSTPAVVRDKLKESIKVILDGDESKLHTFIKRYKDEFRQLPVEAVASPSGLNGMEIYGRSSNIYDKGTPIHVRGALLFNHHIQRLGLTTKYPLITDSDKIKYVYVEKPNPLHEDVISFIGDLPPELGLHKYVDYDKQFNKVFVKAVENIITCMGWTVNTQATLEEFF